MTHVTAGTHKSIQPVIQPLCDDDSLVGYRLPGRCPERAPTGRSTFGCQQRRRNILFRFRLFLITIFLILVGGCDLLKAQNPSSGLLAPNRAIDWSQAGAGTIPARTTICTTLGSGGQSASYSQSVSMSQIASALSSCPSGQTVLLNPGTYTTSSSLINTKSNVTLRGSGANQTILKFTGTSTNCLGIGPTGICAYNGDSGTINGVANILNWTGGYSKGTTTLTAGSAVREKFEQPACGLARHSGPA